MLFVIVLFHLKSSKAQHKKVIGQIFEVQINKTQFSLYVMCLEMKHVDVNAAYKLIVLFSPKMFKSPFNTRKSLDRC